MAVFYIIFFVLAFLSFAELFCLTNRAWMKVAGTVLIIAMVVLSSIRGDGAGDYTAYKVGFEQMTDTSGLLQPRNFFYEPIYSMLQYLVKLLCDNFQIFLFVIACIVMVMQVRFALGYIPNGSVVSKRDSKGIYISGGRLRIRKRYTSEADGGIAWGSYFFTVMFVLWALYKANIIVTRSNISVCICLYATKYIETKEWRKFLLFVFIACGFHYSAAVFLPAYVIYHFHSTFIIKAFIFLSGSAVLSVGIVPLASLYGSIVGGSLGNKIFGYVSGTDFMEGTGMDGSGTILLLKAIANMGILLLVGIYLWQTNKTDRQYEGYFNLYLVGCILYIATLTIGYAFARLSIYYNIFQVPMLLYLVSNREYRADSNRMTHWFLMFFYLLFRFSVNNIGMHYTVFWRNG